MTTSIVEDLGPPRVVEWGLEDAQGEDHLVHHRRVEGVYSLWWLARPLLLKTQSKHGAAVAPSCVTW